MAVDQLPGRMREFASYLDGLLARLEQGAGWCGVFWRRDPEGMRACLEGREVPPWDVVDSLLRDFAETYGPAAAAIERRRARALLAAALSAYDTLPGARDALADRLDVLLREQRYAADRRTELTRLLSAPAGPEDTEALRLDLAWAEDDHERATARCAELRSRLEELELRSAAGAPRVPGRGRKGEAREARPGAGVAPARRGDGGPDAGAAGGDLFSGRLSGERDGAPGAGRLPDERDGATGAGWSVGYGDPYPGPHLAPSGDLGGGPAAEAAFAEPSRAGVGGLDGAPETRSAPRGGPDAGTTTPGTGPEAGAPADAVFRHDLRHDEPRAPAREGGSAPARDGDTVPARDGSTAPTRDGGSTPARPPAPASDPVTTGDPAPHPTSAKPRKRRRGSARFAGMAEGDAPSAAPQATVAAAGRTPRGARFAGGAALDEPVAVPDEAVGAEVRAAVDGAVALLARLRAEGRSGEAHVLLVEAAGWPAARLPVLAGALHRAGLGADWVTLLWEAASLPAGHLVAAADALAAAGREADARQLLRQGVARPAEQIGAAVLRLAGEGRDREARALLDACVRVRTPEEAARSATADPERLVPLLLEAAHAVSEERHWDLVHALRVAGLTR
ncbi:hypothetical protein NX794_02215 [Streptomyces sp. LP11]|uniref:UL36 very large tegument protein n=1 Tax=Streptomyces pyxinicus TaxID=2970331 RepID=A0ABT2AUX3_9ACTN|nr:hypothetical protein [Streptomyces sp. LP11]MCS0600057.1 hypothetical protein [Streptomyces sp. LP11]